MEGKSADGYAPEQQVMQQVAHLLDTQRSASADKRAALQQLEALSSSRADMPNVLAHLLAYADALTPVEVRQAAGLLLKNMAQRTLSLEARLLAHIRSCLLVALASPDRPVREAAGTAIARLAASGGLASFPNLELQLRSAASLTHSEDAADGAADTLVKLCEEAGEELENDRSVGQHLVDTLLMLTRCSLPRVRAKAFQGLNALGNELYPSSLRFRIDTFLESLFALADDPDDGVRSRVCEGLVTVYQLEPEMLAPRLRELVHYMLRATLASHHEVALQASEFWAVLCEGGVPGHDATEPLREVLPQLVSGLMRNMVHAEDDEEVLAAEAEEEEIARSSNSSNNATSAGTKQNATPQSDSIKPVFHSSRSIRCASNARTDGADSGAAAGDDEDSDEEEEDDDIEDAGHWNIRKSSAAGLDTLSDQMGGEMLPFLLHEVQSRIESSDWRQREVAVLALGAVAEGCSDSLGKRLSEVINAVVPLLHDQRPMVRAISCWTLSRYARLLIAAESTGGPTGLRLLNQTLNGILGRIPDHNSKVKSASCTAVCNFAETAGSGIKSYCASIASALGNAFPLYPRQCLRVWFDAMGTLASCVANQSGAFCSADAVDAIFQPLVNFWSDSLGKAERDPFVLSSLANCIASVASAAGHACKHQVRPLAVIAVKSAHAHVPHAQPLEPSTEALSACLELLSTLVEALQSEAEEYVKESNAADLALTLSEHSTPDVRQSALGLLGDVAKYCIQTLQQEKALDTALRSLSPECIVLENILACSNALYALGELVAVCEEHFLQQRGLTIAQASSQILSPSYPKMARENAAVALGRVGCRIPSLLAPYVWDIAERWFSTLRHMRDGIEKRDAFIGAASLVEANPTGVRSPSEAAQLLLAFVSWRDAEAYGTGLLQSLQRAVTTLRGAIGEQGWCSETMPLLESAAQTKLEQMELLNGGR
jgi:transportin-1